MKRYLEKSLRGPISLYTRVLVILLVIMLSLACFPDCAEPTPKTSTQTGQVTLGWVFHPKIDIARVPRTDGRVEFKIKCSMTGTPTDDMWLKWHFPKGVTNIQFSYEPERFSSNGGTWRLPLDPTGQADEVTVSYTPPADVDKVVDKFTADSSYLGLYDQPGTNMAVTTDLTGSSGKAQGEWHPAAAPRAAAVPQDDYYLWETTQWYGADALTVTVDLCQDIVDALQPDTSFVALRFPVQPPTLAYTDPYTLPVSFRSDASPYLALLDERAWPATTVITTPLEYKPQYLTFAENELPTAPGEHWLTLGAVISPTIDCAGVPEIPGGEWEVQTQVWLDFGGVRDTCAGCTLPLYYCYEGQQSPFQASRVLGNDVVTSYQGWGITCLGPQYLTLQPDGGEWELTGHGGAWITPTQTISFTHMIHNRTHTRPITFTLEISSTLEAGWAVYADEQGQTPVTGPFVVDASGGGVRHFWLFGQVPADTAADPHSIIITARTDDAPPTLQQVSDLMWAGDWVAPPGPFWFRIYLPRVVKSDS